MVAVAVQIYLWRQQHTSHHAAALREAKGVLCLDRFSGVTKPLASGGKASREDRVLIQELDANLLYHHVKSPTSNENTKKPQKPKPTETNKHKKSFTFVSELHLAGTWVVPEVAAAHRGACPAPQMAGVQENHCPWFGCVVQRWG